MARRYYSARLNPGRLTLQELYRKVANVYLLFRDRDFLKEKAGVTADYFSDEFKREAAIALRFQPFPIEAWPEEEIAEDNLFDVIEFLYDYVSKPGERVWMRYDSGGDYQDYGSYDTEVGRAEFRNRVNTFLADYKIGFELTKAGLVLALGTDGVQQILNAEIIPYDEDNVDSKVRNAIAKWRNRHLSQTEKREAIRELADVFEWLKKTNKLETVLDRKDEAAIFEIANQFAIRHHNPKQKKNYDPSIWYSWMFHFYLATYHAVIRLLTKKGRVGSTSQQPI
jgi:hypothetical protein